MSQGGGRSAPRGIGDLIAGNSSLERKAHQEIQRIIAGNLRPHEIAQVTEASSTLNAEESGFRLALNKHKQDIKNNLNLIERGAGAARFDALLAQLQISASDATTPRFAPGIVTAVSAEAVPGILFDAIVSKVGSRQHRWHNDKVVAIFELIQALFCTAECTTHYGWGSDATWDPYEAPTFFEFPSRLTRGAYFLIDGDAQYDFDIMNRKEYQKDHAGFNGHRSYDKFLQHQHIVDGKPYLYYPGLGLNVRFPPSGFVEVWFNKAAYDYYFKDRCGPGDVKGWANRLLLVPEHVDNADVEEELGLQELMEQVGFREDDLGGDSGSDIAVIDILASFELFKTSRDILKTTLKNVSTLKSAPHEAAEALLEFVKQSKTNIVFSRDDDYAVNMLVWVMCQSGRPFRTQQSEEEVKAKQIRNKIDKLIKKESKLLYDVNIYDNLEERDGFICPFEGSRNKQMEAENLKKDKLVLFSASFVDRPTSTGL